MGKKNKQNIYQVAVRIRAEVVINVVAENIQEATAFAANLSCKDVVKPADSSENAYYRLKGIYAAGFKKELRQYSDIIQARMQSTGETPAAAMCHLFNETDSKIIRAWLLAACWDMEQGSAPAAVAEDPGKPPVIGTASRKK